MKEWLIRLTLMSLGFIIGISALEFGLSKFAPHPRTYQYFFHEPYEYIGWKGIPNKEGNFTRGRIASYVKINSHGFRDKERTYEKEKGTFRILVLGDSMTEGFQVPLEQTFPYILEERLNSEGSKRFEVINLGIAGFSTAQEYLTLKHYGFKYQPDFVILAFFVGNDVVNNSLILESKVIGRSINDRRNPFFVLNNGELEKIPFNKIKVGNPNKDKAQAKNLLAKFFPNIYYSLRDRGRIKKIRWLANFWWDDLLWKIGIKKSNPELLVLNKSNKNETGIPYYIFAEEYSPEWQNAWEVTKALILRISKVLEENKIGLLVVVIPDECEFGPDLWSRWCNTIRTIKFDLEKPERILSEFLKEHRIDYLQLLPEFKKYTNDTSERLYFPYTYDNHWNASGHALAAELIYDKLKNDNLISSKEENRQY